MRAVPPSTRAQTTQHAAPGSSSQHAGPQDPQQDQERERGQDAGSASGPTGSPRREGAWGASRSRSSHEQPPAPRARRAPPIQRGSLILPVGTGKRGMRTGSSREGLLKAFLFLTPEAFSPHSSSTLVTSYVSLHLTLTFGGHWRAVESWNQLQRQINCAWSVSRHSAATPLRPSTQQTRRAARPPPTLTLDHRCQARLASGHA